MTKLGKTRSTFKILGKSRKTRKTRNAGKPARVKGPIKGPAISNSLANLINTTCTSQCVTDDLVAKYRVPENCDKLCAPMINNEIWKILNKRAQSYYKCFSDIQNLVATSTVPVIKLFEVVKPHIAGNQVAKTLFSDIITMMGQVQYNLSLHRSPI